MVATRDLQRHSVLPFLLLGFLCLLISPQGNAVVLPEDRSDAMYHLYTGGGVDIDGPSILVRKQVLEEVSVSANYYIDSITSASIDVETYASPYTEERTEYKFGADYLRNKTLMSVNYTQSDENDFEAKTWSFGLSQDFFGDLTTLTMGYARGDDTVGRRDSDFAEDVDRHNYSVGFSQVLTRNMLANLSLNIITDEGYLNNPYRRVRYLDGNGGQQFQEEVYPRTRTSTAIAARTANYFSNKAGLHTEFRYFQDTWDIQAFNVQAKYLYPMSLPFYVFDQATFEISARYYDQTQAEFYADLFPFVNAQNFMARDKEMSTFSNYALGVGIDWDFVAGFVEKGSVSLHYTFRHYDYENFRDARLSLGEDPQFAPGEEPFYDYSASVVRLFVSVWY
ncbi:MAG: DUF3570 domain-containing protein [Pseudomonadota bacterium]